VERHYSLHVLQNHRRNLGLVGGTSSSTLRISSVCSTRQRTAGSLSSLAPSRAAMEQCCVTTWASHGASRGTGQRGGMAHLYGCPTPSPGSHSSAFALAALRTWLLSALARPRGAQGPHSIPWTPTVLQGPPKTPYYPNSVPIIPSNPSVSQGPYGAPVPLWCPSDPCGAQLPPRTPGSPRDPTQCFSDPHSAPVIPVLP